MTKTKKKLYKKWCYTSWKADVVLLVGDRTSAMNWIKKNLSKSRLDRISHLLVDDKDTTCEGEYFHVGGGGGIIWLRAFDIYPLAHEISHAVFGLLNAKGCVHNNETDEAYAYLYEHMLNSFYPWKRR